MEAMMRGLVILRCNLSEQNIICKNFSNFYGKDRTGWPEKL